MLFIWIVKNHGAYLLVLQTMTWRKGMPNITSQNLLNEAILIQQERGKEYEQDNSEERSFQKTATAFNAITGKHITPAEVALLLQVLKDVRQWANPNRFHYDSVLDCISYAALKGEELSRQFSECPPATSFEAKNEK